jgi:SpoVK/Ycf46/Vps4 family AAA+-type ATPase
VETGLSGGGGGGNATSSAVGSTALTTPNVTWTSIGGLFDVKRQLVELVEHPVLYQPLYERAPISLPRGILLFGPSGCGKSLLPIGLAHKLNLRLIVVKGPALLDKYIGASEHNVRQVFRQAHAAAPCILFFDDLDALAPKRGADNTGVTDRVVNQLLTFLDGVETSFEDGGDGDGEDDNAPKKKHNSNNNSKLVYIMAATSRPDKVDAALLRPGRLDRHLYVGPPTGGKDGMEQSNNDVFSTLLRQRISASQTTSVRLDDTATALVKSKTFLSPTSNPLLRLVNDDGNHEERTKIQDSMYNNPSPPLSLSLPWESFTPADFKAAIDTAYLDAVHECLSLHEQQGAKSCKEQQDDRVVFPKNEEQETKEEEKVIDVDEAEMQVDQDQVVLIRTELLVKALQTTKPSAALDDSSSSSSPQGDDSMQAMYDTFRDPNSNSTSTNSKGSSKKRPTRKPETTLR